MADILTLAVDSQAAVFNVNEFKPMAFVEGMVPPTRAQFWPPPVKVRNPLGPAGRDRRGARAAPPPVQYAQLPIEDVADEFANEVPEQVLEGADAAMEEAAAWQVSSDDEDHAEFYNGHGRPGLSRHILSSVIDGRRPPSLGGSNLYRGLRRPGSLPPPPPAPDHHRPHNPYIGRKDHRSLWPRFLHSENSQGQKSYLRLSTTWGKTHSDAMAMCYWRGERCQRSRSMLQERPIGELWAW